MPCTGPRSHAFLAWISKKTQLTGSGKQNFVTFGTAVKYCSEKFRLSQHRELRSILATSTQVQAILRCKVSVQFSARRVL